MAVYEQQPFRCRRYGTAGLIMLILLIAWPPIVCAESHRIKAVVLDHWPPQYQSGEYGQPTGFAIDVMDQVAAIADIDVVYEVVNSWEEAVEALQSGRVDIIPNHGITLERKKWLSFTSPVETFSVVIFVRAATSEIDNPADLAGHAIATVQYDIGTHLISQFRNIEHKIYATVNEAFLELLAGHVDALIYPRPVMMKLAIEAGLEERIKPVGPPLAEIKRGISLRKDNQALLQILEAAVNKFILTKKYEQIYTQWYGRVIPFWTAKRMIGTMIGLVFLFILWHSFRLTKVNQRLKTSMADKNRAEAALVASEEKYRLIVENQTDLTIKMDAQNRLLFASPSFCDAFGVSSLHLEGIQFLSLVHRKDREKVKLAMQSLQVVPHTCRHEGRALTPKGWQWFAWSNKAILDEDGQITEIISVGRNTTERKEAEAQLQGSEERFRAIFEQAADAVMLLNRQSLTVAEFNGAALYALGYTQDAFSRIHLKNLIVPKSGEAISEAVERVLDHRQHPVEIMLKTQSGQVRHFLVKQRPLNVNDGEFLLGIWHDITERKMLEEHLVHSQKMEAIGTLAGGISHDFNNILSIILGNIELAVMDVSKNHPVAGRLREVQTAGLRAKEVVRQLLSFSRKEPEERTSVLLAPLIDESLQLLRASIPTSIDIRKHFTNTDMTIMADDTQIHQVMINLLTNAAQAMGDEGGVIHVSLSSIDLNEQASQGYNIVAGPYALIRIRDTGSGMAPDIIERIFDPYFTTKKIQGGTGMGLSIVHGIVTRQNGIIEVEDSRLGHGTTFKILLPLSDTILPSKEIVDQQAGTGDERVLLVDDEPAIVTIGRQYLEKLGYHAQVSINPVEALADFKADPSRFDLIITDMTMPEMSGKALAKAILKLRPGMPIILCSGYHSDFDEKCVESLGITAFLQKPYNIKVLADTVRQALSEKIIR